MYSKASTLHLITESVPGKKNSSPYRDTSLLAVSKSTFYPSLRWHAVCHAVKKIVSQVMSWNSMACVIAKRQTKQIQNSIVLDIRTIVNIVSLVQRNILREYIREINPYTALPDLSKFAFWDFLCEHRF